MTQEKNKQKNKSKKEEEGKQKKKEHKWYSNSWEKTMIYFEITLGQISWIIERDRSFCWKCESVLAQKQKSSMDLVSWE